MKPYTPEPGRAAKPAPKPTTLEDFVRGAPAPTKLAPKPAAPKPRAQETRDPAAERFLAGMEADAIPEDPMADMPFAPMSEEDFDRMREYGSDSADGLVPELYADSEPDLFPEDDRVPELPF